MTLYFSFFLFPFCVSEQPKRVGRIRISYGIWMDFCVRMLVWCQGTGLDVSDSSFLSFDDCIEPCGGIGVTTGWV